MLFASQSFYPLIGGVSTYLLNLGRGLKEAGHQVMEVHLRPPFEVSTDEIEGIAVYRVPREPLDRKLLAGYSKFKEAVYEECHGYGRRFVKRAEEMDGFEEYAEINEQLGRQIAELLTEHPAQVVHVHDFQLLFLYRYIPRGIPLVFTWHIPIHKRISKNLREFLIKNLAEFDKVVFSTKEYVKAAVDMGLPKEKVELIYPVSNTELFRPVDSRDSFRKKYRISQKAKVILCVQRIDLKSGHEQLLRAMPLILKEEPNAVLVLVGTESLSNKISKSRQRYQRRVKELIKELKLGRKVRFLGSIPYESLREAYCAADAVALTSKNEGFGLAVCEAMLCGKAVVGTKVGGIKEQIVHGKNGYLCKVGDYRTTAKYLLKLIKNPELAARLGKNARAYAKDKFDMKKSIEKHIELYTSLLREKSIEWNLKMFHLEDVDALVVDLDRTLSSAEGEVEEHVQRELKSLKKPIILATGRNFKFVKSLAKKYRFFSAIVAENGCIVYLPSLKQWIALDSSYMKNVRKRLKKAKKRLSFGKVVVSFAIKDKKRILTILGRLKKYVSLHKNVDRYMLTPKEWDKGKGVLLALQMLNLNPEKTVLIGDGENDREMFSVPGYKVAVANAVPELKAIADKITQGKSEQGVLEVIRELKS